MWDQIFGTQHQSYDHYETQLGLQDSAFPVEQDTSVGGFAAAYAAQLVYPLAKLMPVRTSEPAPESVATKGLI